METIISFKLNKELYDKFEQICSNEGITPDEAFNLLIEKTIQNQILPSEIIETLESDENDPFYSPKNIAYLIDQYEKFKKGELKMEEHDLIRE